MIIKVI